MDLTKDTTVRPAQTSRPPVRSIPTSRSSAQSVLTVGRTLGDAPLDMGTIVSDKRRHRMSFGESLQSAFNEWMGKTKDNVSDIRDRMVAPAPLVEEVIIPRANERRAVIEKAARFSNLPSKETPHTTMAGIRTYKSDVSRLGHGNAADDTTPATPPISSTVPVATTERVRPNKVTASIPVSVAPVVSQKTRTQTVAYQGARAPMKKSSLPPSLVPPTAPKVTLKTTPIAVAPVVSHTTKSTPLPVPPVSKPEPLSGYDSITVTPQAPRPIEAVPAPVLETTPSPTLPRNQIFVRNTRAEEQEEVTSEPDIVPEFRSAPIPATAQEELKSIRTKAPAPVAATSDRDLSRLIPYLIRGGVVVVFGVVLAFVARGMFNSTTDTPPPATPGVVLPVSPFVETQETNTITLGGDSYALMSDVRHILERQDLGNTLLYPQRVDGGTTRSATASEFLLFVGARIPEGMRRSLDDAVTLGSVTTTVSEPFVLLRSNNFDELFVGTLAWEATMHADLAPLFGETSPSEVTFTDAIRNNAPTRILRDDAGNEVLVYSIRDNRTLIITSSSEALAAVVAQLPAR